ncbi:MAG: hypothetical protein CSA72_06460 [Rhodobacterales bacterium]|nr:MAG: hypothetical protein CSA72_06460 [Rhodobacterales bacterium]
MIDARETARKGQRADQTRIGGCHDAGGARPLGKGAGGTRNVSTIGTGGVITCPRKIAASGAQELPQSTAFRHACPALSAVAAVSPWAEIAVSGPPKVMGAGRRYAPSGKTMTVMATRRKARRHVMAQC